MSEGLGGATVHLFEPAGKTNKIPPDLIFQVHEPNHSR